MGKRAFFTVDREKGAKSRASDASKAPCPASGAGFELFGGKTEVLAEGGREIRLAVVASHLRGSGDADSLALNGFGSALQPAFARIGKNRAASQQAELALQGVGIA